MKITKLTFLLLTMGFLQISFAQSIILDFDELEDLSVTEFTEDGYDWVITSGDWLSNFGSCSEPNTCVMNGGRLKLADGSAFNLVAADIRTWSGIYNATVRGYKNGEVVYEVNHAGLTDVCEYYEYGFYDIDELEGFIGQTGIAMDNLVITFDAQAQNDLGLFEILGYDKYALNGENYVSVLVKNLGSAPITSVDLNWTVDNYSTVNTTIYSELNIAPTEEYILEHPDPIEEEPGEYDLVVWLSDLQGTNADSNPTNDSAYREIFIVTQSVQPTILIEEFSTTSCGYCPRGHLMLDTMTANFDYIIGVAHHAGFGTDAMTIPAHEHYAELWASGAPTAAINRRYGGVGTSDWEMISEEINNDLALGEITMEGSVFDPETRELEVTINATFLLPMTGDFRFNVFIVEDSLHGEGNGWDQANYFNEESGHPFYGLGDPIVGYRHNHVVRHVLPGSDEPECWGDVGIIPQSVIPDEIYSQTFNFIIPEDYIIENVHLVGFVSEYQDEIINTVKIDDLNMLVSTGKIYKKPEITIYPVPASDVITIKSGSEIEQVKLYNQVGQLVNTMTASNNIVNMNVADMETGIYFVKVFSHDQIITKKLVIE